MQYVLATLASLRAAGLMVPLRRLARLLSATASMLDFLGSDLCGMALRVTGIVAVGNAAARAWHMDAYGAFSSPSMLSLAEFKPDIKRWGMITDINKGGSLSDAAQKI
jgi:hypothetical protein